MDLGANGKRINNFLLVINSNCGRISFRFRDIDAFSTPLVWRPLAEERPAISTQSISLRRWTVQLIIGYNISLAVVGSQNAKSLDFAFWEPTTAKLML